MRPINTVSQSSIVALVIAVLLGILTYLALQVSWALESLKSAPSDNVQWAMAQSQVELLILDDKVESAIRGEEVSLADVRQRFDILYSRMVTLRDSDSFHQTRGDIDTIVAINRTIDDLDAEIPYIDGTDEELTARLPELNLKLEALQPVVRDISLQGVKAFAQAADRERQTFADLLWHTALVAVACLLLMILTLLILVHQYRLLRRRSEQLVISNERYSSAIRAALDAIVLCDGSGTILDVNPAAERTFGYSREGVVGAAAAELIVPPTHRAEFREAFAGLLKARGGSARSWARMEMSAMRADGGTFAAEFAFGLTEDAQGPIVISYIRDISSRRSYEAALTAARDEALAAARAKSNFLAVMSHEMRTPLNGVMGILDLLRRTRLTAKQRQYVDTATLSGEILQSHIEDVLDITRIEAGARSINPSRFDLAELLGEIRDINQPAAAARGNALEVVCAITPGLVTQDRHCIRQVLINLVGNAVKFTRDGRITIEAQGFDRDGAHWLRLMVSDTGIGMPPEDLGRIFEDFVMLDASYKRNTAGSGLGLGICRRVVGLLGGTISVDSTPGAGSRFTVEVPILAGSYATAKARPRGAEPPPVICRDLDVLLVEDNEINRLVAREMLQLHGCRVREAVDGVEGVDQARGHRFDLILMDVSMPNLDGISATRQIRAGGGLSQGTTIIGLTAHAMQAEQGSLREAGMQGCLVKPLRAEALNTLLSRIATDHLPAQETEPVAAPRPPAPVLIAEETFRSLVDMLPGAFLTEQIERFARELEGCAEAFAPETVAAMELRDLAARAHKQAGSAAVFGAKALRAALQEVETAALNGAAGQIPALCASVVGLAGPTRRALIEAAASRDADAGTP